MWSGMPSYPKICLDLPALPLLGSIEMARLKIVQNERLINFKGSISVFSS